MLVTWLSTATRPRKQGGVQNNTLPITRQVITQNNENKSLVAVRKNSEKGEFLLSDSEEDDTICRVRISDKGSESQYACVLIQVMAYYYWNMTVL